MSGARRPRSLVRRALPGPALTGVRRARRALRRVPRNPAQARALGERIVERRIVGTARGRRALRLAWAVRMRLPGPDERLREQTHRWGHRLARRGHLTDAVALYADAERGIGSPAPRLALTVQRGALDLRLGNIPADLWDRVHDLLALADELVAAGDLVGAGARLQEAFNLAYHRTLHFEDLRSPLADDPDGFLAPFRKSAAFTAVQQPTGRTRPVRPTPAGRPRRVLFTTFMNWNFVGDIVEDYRATAGVEVRTLDLKEIADGPWRAQPVDLVTRRLQQSLGSDPVTVPDDLREAFDWADSVFVEWGHRALPWVSLLPEVGARVVARIHSYEAFTPMPLHTDWSGIDDLVFVSPHIRALVEAAVPALAEGPRLHTIPNRNLLAPYRQPKLAGADRTLGLVGWNNVTKDPGWAVELLEELLKQDPRWRLRLVGHNFPRSNITGPATRYRDDLERRLDALGEAVERPGFSTDIAEALRHIGVIVSSSRREGTHEGLIQGTASGAWPVVRDWPYVARWGGARTMVRDEWVVDTPQQAAAALLDAAEDPERFGALRAEAADWVATRYDWSVVRPALDALLLDDAPA
jgi:glycosyl transferase family 1